MAYRSDRDEKVPVSSFALSDWLAASVALGIGAALFMMVVYFLLWFGGMPGPLLWMSEGNVPADILMICLTIAPVLILLNWFGSLVIVGFFAALRRFRSR